MSDDWIYVSDSRRVAESLRALAPSGATLDSHRMRGWTLWKLVVPRAALDRAGACALGHTLEAMRLRPRLFGDGVFVIPRREGAMRYILRVLWRRRAGG